VLVHGFPVLLGRISYLWEVDTERTHVQPIEETAETLIEAVQALIQKL
jgi:hypothetical protein